MQKKYNPKYILYCDIAKNGLKTFYSTDIFIRHLEQVSTNMRLETREKKLEFVIENMERSLKVLERKLLELSSDAI